MAGYCTIKRDAYGYDRRLKGLSDAAHRLHMGLWLGGSGQTMCGVRRFVVAEALVWVPDWDLDKARAAFSELAAAGLILHDAERDLVFVGMVLEHGPIRGANGIKGAAKALDDLPDSAVLAPVLEHLLAGLGEAVESLEPAAGGSGKKAETAARTREELREIGLDLEDRLARCHALDTPCQGDAKGVHTPSVPHPEGVGIGCGGGINPVGMGCQGGSSGKPGDTPTCGGLDFETPRCGPEARGYGGGTEGVRRGSRARAYARPDPEPEQEPPPQSPPTGNRPGNGQGKSNGKGPEAKIAANGRSEYAGIG